MIDYVHEYEMSKPKQHPVGMTADGAFQDNRILFNSNADWISPSSGTAFIYRHNPPAADGSKVILADTDHLWGIGGNHKWVWKSFLRGINPIFMDPWEPLPGRVKDMGIGLCEDINRRDNPVWQTVRKNIGYTRRYAEKINLNKMLPHGELSTSGYCLANPLEEYLVYLPEGGTVGMDLGHGGKRLFNVEWFNPATGGAITGKPIEIQPYSGNEYMGFDPLGYEFTAPFDGDAVLYLYAMDKDCNAKTKRP